MSEIRMCDQCGRIFSLNERGWSQYQKSGVSYGGNGNSATLHMCPDHQQVSEPILRPVTRNPYLDDSKAVTRRVEE